MAGCVSCVFPFHGSIHVVGSTLKPKLSSYFVLVRLQPWYQASWANAIRQPWKSTSVDRLKDRHVWVLKTLQLHTRQYIYFFHEIPWQSGEEFATKVADICVYGLYTVSKNKTSSMQLYVTFKNIYFLKTRCFFFLWSCHWPAAKKSQVTTFSASLHGLRFPHQELGLSITAALNTHHGWFIKNAQEEEKCISSCRQWVLLYESNENDVPRLSRTLAVITQCAPSKFKSSPQLILLLLKLDGHHLNPTHFSAVLTYKPLQAKFEHNWISTSAEMIAVDLILIGLGSFCFTGNKKSWSLVVT